MKDMKAIRVDAMSVLKIGGQQLQELGQAILDEGEEGAQEAFEVITLAAGYFAQIHTAVQMGKMDKARFESNTAVIEATLRKKLKAIKNERYHLAVESLLSRSLGFLTTTVLGAAKTYLPIPS